MILTTNKFKTVLIYVFATLNIIMFFTCNNHQPSLSEAKQRMIDTVTARGWPADNIIVAGYPAEDTGTFDTTAYNRFVDSVLKK